VKRWRNVIDTWNASAPQPIIIEGYSTVIASLGDDSKLFLKVPLSNIFHTSILFFRDGAGRSDSKIYHKTRKSMMM